MFKKFFNVRKKNYLIVSGKVLVFFVIPLFLIIWIFWIDVDLKVRTTFEGERPYFSISQADYLKKTRSTWYNKIKYSIKDVFEAPDFYYYNLCIRNKSEVKEGSVKFIGVVVKDFISKNNNEYDEIKLALGETKCFPFRRDELLSYNHRAITVLKPSLPMNYKINYNVLPEDEVKPFREDQWTVSIMFLFAWWAIMLLCFGVYKQFKKSK